MIPLNPDAVSSGDWRDWTLGHRQSPKPTHKEAFCLMMYQDEKTGEIEIVWNSRDGVTPFCCTSKRGNPMRHQNWNLDLPVPGFKPAKGMRIFVNATPENTRPSVREYIEKHWEASRSLGDCSMEATFGTKEEAEIRLLESWLEQPGTPHLVEVE